VLIFATVAVYAPVATYPFFTFDTVDFVTDNPHIENGITAHNVMWAFTSVDAYNWHPLTWLSHIVIADFFGMSPRAHHLANLAIHSASGLLLFILLLRLTVALWRSIFVAALFALHPLHVESVAWVAERKDVLSAFFCFLTLFLYAGYVAKPITVRYLLTFLSFVFGLMSKSMLVTLPILMLLLDFWPLNRFQNSGYDKGLSQLIKRLITLTKEKIPFFVCSLFAGLVTLYAQNSGRVMIDLRELPFQLRIENALIAYVKYIGKTFWPQDLAFFYPFPSVIEWWQIISSLFILLLISIVAIRIKNRSPYFVVGWLWFLITLLPVIGLIQVGGQAMADRYSYIPITGLFIVVVWGFPEFTSGIRYWRTILALLAITVIFVSAALTRQQLSYWQDSISVFRRTLQVTKNNYEIHSILGTVLADKGDLDTALAEHFEALRINPGYSGVHNNLGLTFAARGDYEAAIRQYFEALKLNSENFDAHYNLGLVFQKTGNLDAEIFQYQEALRINPNFTRPYNNLGIAFAKKGELDKAIDQFQRALKVNPGNTKAQNNLEHSFAIRKMKSEGWK
jgi:tetratricopeptide (TPR) repeat protein